MSDKFAERWGMAFGDKRKDCKKCLNKGNKTKCDNCKNYSNYRGKK